MEIGESCEMFESGQVEACSAPPPTLRFRTVDIFGNAVQSVAYRIVVGDGPRGEDERRDGMTGATGLTPIASQVPHERACFYFSWSKLRVNTGWIKG